MNRAVNLVRLNARVAGLALRGQWLGPEHVALGYDDAAVTYNTAWQRRVKPVTDELLARLPQRGYGTVIDLGCGTGYVALKLTPRRQDAKTPR